MGIKKWLLLVCLVVTSVQSYGQRVRYRDYRDEFSTKNYRQNITHQKYSPLLAGIGNYLVPSSGYFYVGEPLRGGIVLGSILTTYGLFVYGLTLSMSENYSTGQSPSGSRELMLAGLVATGVIHLWSIYDVVKIAKIKNLAYQQRGISLRMAPSLTKVYQGDSAIYGFQLNFNF